MVAKAWKRNPKKSFKGRSLSKSENVACTATRASPPQFRSVFGQSLVGRGDTCTSSSVHLQKKFPLQTNLFFTAPAKYTFFPEPFLRRESGPCGFPFNSSTDLYVFTCARADQSTIEKNSPCALGARALLDKLYVPLNNSFSINTSMSTETIKLSTILGCK